MTDRELLELAARAAGIKALKSPDGILRDCTGFDPMMNIYAAKPWNPLTDDGDALRLAVRLGLFVPTRWEHEKMEKCGLNVHEATRRAIVGAAAEIGKNV